MFQVGERVQIYLCESPYHKKQGTISGILPTAPWPYFVTIDGVPPRISAFVKMGLVPREAEGELVGSPFQGTELLRIL